MPDLPPPPLHKRPPRTNALACDCIRGNFASSMASRSSLNGYITNIKLLRTVFKIDFLLHETKVTGVDQVTARCGGRVPSESWAAPCP